MSAKSPAPAVVGRAHTPRDVQSSDVPYWIPDANLHNFSQFYAVCQPTDVLGAAVGITTGAYTVTTVTSDDQALAIGVIIYKPNDNIALVQHYGLVNKIYDELEPGSLYAIDQNGQPALAVDLGGNVAYLQPLGHAVDSETLFVQPAGFTGGSSGDGGGGSAPAPHSGGYFHAGSTDPDGNTPGQKGDFYLNTTSGQLFGPAQ